MFDIPPVRRRIAAINKFEAIPLQDETYRSIDRVESRKAANYHPIFVEDDFVVCFVGELVNFKLTAIDEDILPNAPSDAST